MVMCLHYISEFEISLKKIEFFQKFKMLYIYISRQSYELRRSEIFCLVLIRSFPGSFCCAEFAYKDTHPHHIDVFSKIQDFREKIEFLLKIDFLFFFKVALGILFLMISPAAELTERMPRCAVP